MVEIKDKSAGCTRLHRDERGQVAVAVVLLILGVFILAGLSLDSGLWFFDHRTAQAKWHGPCRRKPPAAGG